MSEWKPDEEDIQFGQQLIRTIKQGGTWAAPKGVCVYEFDHENKTLIERLPSPLAEFRKKTRILFQTLGWTVQDSDLEPPHIPAELVERLWVDGEKRQEDVDAALKPDAGNPEWN